MTFSNEFIWGSATSSYQIEGAVDKHGRGASVWDTFCRTPGRVRDGHTGDIACDHVNRFKDDVAIMKQIGLAAYRFSIAWPRVIPDGAGAVSETGLAFYDRLVDELLAAGIEPWATLFHWDYPVALYQQGGWLNPASPYWFEEYVRAVVDRLSDRVAYWFTLNEPQVFIQMGHDTGEHAPGLRLAWPDLVTISHHALVAHGCATRTIRERARTKPVVTWAPVGVVRYPLVEDAASIDAAREATFDATQQNVWNNTWFDDPVFLGEYPADGLSVHGQHLPTGWERDLELIHQPMDLFALNLYKGDPVSVSPDGTVGTPETPPGSPHSAFGWEITPEALYWGVKFFHERYKKPIVVSENGLSCLDWVALDGRVHDPQRIDFTTRYLRELERAIDEGVDVRGYFHWSLMDNFEWAEGYHQRFGLVHVDFQTLQRTLKDSAKWYSDVIRTNGAAIHDAGTIARVSATS